MIIFLVLYVLATLLLGASIVGVTQAYKIKVDTNFILASLIGLGGIFACSLLALQSIIHYFIYGAIMAAFMVFLTTIGKAKPVQGMVSCILSFFFWPQYIVFTIFTILNIKTYMDKDG